MSVKPEGKEASMYIDVAEPKSLEIIIREDAKTVWVNVDGICRFRACKIQGLFIHDQRDVNLRKVLEAGLALVKSADAHVSHGGPTKADAQKWILLAHKTLAGS
jgi:hypothetical protein